MFGKNQRLVVTLCATAILFGFQDGINTSVFGQYQSSAATQNSYYNRPGALEPDEFLARSQQTNSDSVLHQYERMLRNNSSQTRQVAPRYSPNNSTIYDQPSGYARQQLPRQLVPPVSAASSTANGPFAGRTVAPTATPLRPIQQNKQLAQPGFSLSDTMPPVTKPMPAVVNGTQLRQATAQRTIRQRVNQPTQPRVNSTTARIVPRNRQGVSQVRPTGTRARIVSYVQDVPGENQRPSGDPFAEPPADILGPGNQNTQGDPFADPPADVLQNQPRDPFEEPPADIRNGNRQPPSGLDPQTEQPPEQPLFPGVDPFPNTPDSVDPNSDATTDERQPDTRELEDPGPAPDRPPNTDRRDPDLRRGDNSYRTGPYQSFNGYEPKPLLQPPPERYLPTEQQVQQQFPQQFQQQPAYDYGSPDQMLSQPTLFGDGFETGQLYQGGSHDDDTRYASYECDVCNQPGSLRMPLFDGLKNRLSRMTRIGCYDYQTCDANCGGGPVNRLLGRSQLAGRGQTTGRGRLFGTGQLLGQGQGRLMSQQLSMGPACGGCGGCQGCCLPADNSYDYQIAAAPVFNQTCPAPCNNIGNDNFGSDCCCEPMFYFAAFGGYTQLQGGDTLGLSSDLAVPTIASGGSLEFDDGFGVGLALGQWQGRNLRTEVEYVFRRNDVDSISREFALGQNAAGSSQNVDGSINAHAGMFNAIWDFNRRLFGFRPYAGAGVGFAFFDVEATDVATGALIANSSNQSSFAYQFIAGVSRQCSANKEWFVEYRYFSGDSLQLDVAEFSGDSGYESNNVFFGFRKRF